MPKMPVNIAGGAYSDDAKPWSVQDVVGYITVNAEVEGTRANAILRQLPGPRPFARPATENFDGRGHRGARNVEGQPFLVIGNGLFTCDKDGVMTHLGDISGRGLVSMTHNQITGGNEVVIGAGTASYVWNTVTETLTQITDDGFPGFLVCDYINSLVVGIEPHRRFFFNSALADALSYNTLERYESEASPDRLRSLIVSHLELWLFNEGTIEVFENTGVTNALFENKRIVIEMGCAATHSVKKIDNSIIFLGSDGSVYQTNGYSLTRISTHAMEQAIRGCKWSRAFAMVWADSGHKVYYLTFPDGKTWGFDCATRQWHRRQSEGRERWNMSTLFQWNNKWYCGSYTDGTLYELDWDYCAEGANALIRERVSPVLHADQNRVTVDELELLVNTGGPVTSKISFDEEGVLVTASPDLTDHKLLMALSRDGGQSFGSWTEHDLGQTGDFIKTLKRQRMGTCRHLVAKFRVTSPVRADLIACSLSITKEP